jgi:uncharacterized protein (TIGR01777 family)
MKIAITGAFGLIGSALSELLRARGDEVVSISRGPSGALRWSVQGGLEPADGLSGCDAVVHLAAESLAARRWTTRQKREILDSRVLGTRSIVEALEAASPRPRVLVNASAVGVYGDCADAWVDETSPVGDGFMAEVCRAWEREANEASKLGVRVVVSRTGVVLSRRDGMLPRLLPVFRFGLGGRLGNGRQYLSWIHERDAARALALALDDERIEGPLNVTAPAPVTNAELTRLLGRTLHRPTVFAVPAFALRIVLGELASALLEGQRVEPAGLRARGFSFEFDELHPALEDLLNRSASDASS